MTPGTPDLPLTSTPEVYLTDLPVSSIQVFENSSIDFVKTLVVHDPLERSA